MKSTFFAAVIVFSGCNSNESSNQADLSKSVENISQLNQQVEVLAKAVLHLQAENEELRVAVERMANAETVRAKTLFVNTLYVGEEGFGGQVFINADSGNPVWQIDAYGRTEPEGSIKARMSNGGVRGLFYEHDTGVRFWGAATIEED